MDKKEYKAMNDHEDENVLLDDQSMDECHDLDEDLQASVDTNASPMKKDTQAGRRQRFDDHDEKEEDEDDDDFGKGLSSDEDDDSSVGSLGNSKRYNMKEDEMSSSPSSSSDEDSDGPPEIPGSPVSGGRSHIEAEEKQASPSRRASLGVTLIPFSRAINHLKVNNDGEEEYEMKPTSDDEGNPSAQAADRLVIHGDSSSGSEEDDDQMTLRRNLITKPTDNLDNYRDLLPKEYYDQKTQRIGIEKEEEEEKVNTRTKSRKKKQDKKSSRKQMLEEEHDQANHRPTVQEKPLRDDEPLRSPDKQKPHNSNSTGISNVTSTACTKANTTNKWKLDMAVPKEVEALFKLIDEYKPEEIDLDTTLKPFLPDFVPSVGVPFDGIQISRPDGKIDDDNGTKVLIEPIDQSNEAELQLLLEMNSKRKNVSSKNRLRNGIVHSIEDALHRPREIDAWIASVAKIQRSKPMDCVVYTKPMPSIDALMELWPEEFEALLPKDGLKLSQLDVPLRDLVKIMCGLLDIPVYEDRLIHSLHLMLSVYAEFKNNAHFQQQFMTQDIGMEQVGQDEGWSYDAS